MKRPVPRFHRHVRQILTEPAPVLKSHYCVELVDTVVDRIPEVFGLREAVLVAVEAWGVDEYYVISLAKTRLLVAGSDDCRACGDERPQEFGPQFPSVAENEC